MRLDVANAKTNSDARDPEHSLWHQRHPIAVGIDHRLRRRDAVARNQKLAIARWRVVRERLIDLVDLQDRAAEIVTVLLVAAADRLGVVERQPDLGSARTRAPPARRWSQSRCRCGVLPDSSSPHPNVPRPAVQMTLWQVRQADNPGPAKAAGFVLAPRTGLSSRRGRARMTAAETENSAQRRLQPVVARGHHGAGARRPPGRTGLQRSDVPRTVLALRHAACIGHRRQAPIPTAIWPAVIETVKTRQIDALLPVHEQAYLFAAARRQLPPGLGIALADFEAFEQVQSKATSRRAC